MTWRQTFLLAVGLLCGAVTLGAEPLPIQPLLLGRLPMFDLKVVSGGQAGSGSSASGIGTANTVAKFTGVSTLGNSTITDDGTTVTVNTATKFGASVTNGANQASGGLIFLDSTFPASTTSTTSAITFRIASALTTASQQQRALFVQMTDGGAVGTQIAATIGADQKSLVTAGANISGPASRSIWGVYSGANTTGISIGVYGENTGGGTNAYGVVGKADAGTTSSVGVAGISTAGTAQRAGGYFSLGTSATPVLASTSALMADNAAVAASIFIARDNGAAVPTTGPAATFQILDGAEAQAGNEVLTSGTMTAETQGLLRTVTHSYTWTNAMVTALPTTAGDISVATLPAKTVVKNAYVVITGAAVGPATVTVACGRTSALYIDYIVASDAKAAANTVYGDASGERGTNLVGYDLPSYTGTTTVNCHFISTGANLSTVTGSTGRVILETALVP